MFKCLSENLLENALSSLQEGLIKLSICINGNDKSLKNSILFFDHFIELSIKYFISTVEPELIYKKTNNKENTLNFYESIYFFIKLNENGLLKDKAEDYELTKTVKILKKAVKNLRKYRNEIQHGPYELNVFIAQSDIADTLKIINHIYSTYFNINLIECLTEELQEMYGNALDVYEYKLSVNEELAEEYAQNYERDLFDGTYSYNAGEMVRSCPSCWEKTLVYHPSIDEFKCTHCDNVSRVVECVICNEILPDEEAIKIGEWGYFCGEMCLHLDMKSKGCD